MKKILLFICIICMTSFTIHAQRSDNDRKERFEKFQKERTEFISKEMKLTDEESDKFWPVCNELQLKKFEVNKPLREEMGKIRRAERENKKISDADYKKLIELGAEIKVKEVLLEKEYFSKFMEIIPAEKVFLYQKAEQEFGRKMMDNRRRAISK